MLERKSLMKLNLPILEQLENSQNILIAGAGGGFDIYLGLPIYFTLHEMGKTVHLANYSFSDFDLSERLMSETEKLLENALLGVRGELKLPFPYFPEGYLAQWFKEEQGEALTVWMFKKTGAAPLVLAYTKLIEHLGIDAIVLVDGGVDSLMRGDEIAPGTLLEDSITLAAVDMVDVPLKILVCGGFGSEVEESVSHYHALENIAALAKEGAFWGSCALTPQMEAFQFYESACRYAWERPDHHKSHISTRVIPAVHGEFGNHHMYPPNTPAIFVSPIMSLYWFFDAHAVIQRNLIIDLLKPTNTTDEAFRLFAEYYKKFANRAPKSIPY